MRDHTKLRAFECADDIAVLVYKATQTFPREEIYGLTSQMRRAAVSAASNICCLLTACLHTACLQAGNNAGTNGDGRTSKGLRVCWKPQAPHLLRECTFISQKRDKNTLATCPIHEEHR